MAILRAMNLKLQVAPITYNCQQKGPVQTIRLNSFGESNPALAKYWHPIKNGVLSPNDVTATSRKIVWWRCLKNENHEWMDTVSGLLKKIKTDFLSCNNFTEKSFEAQLKKVCSICVRSKVNE